MKIPSTFSPTCFGVHTGLWHSEALYGTYRMCWQGNGTWRHLLQHGAFTTPFGLCLCCCQVAYQERVCELGPQKAAHPSDMCLMGGGAHLAYEKDEPRAQHYG